MTNRLTSEWMCLLLGGHFGTIAYLAYQLYCRSVDELGVKDTATHGEQLVAPGMLAMWLHPLRADINERFLVL